jgi:hypothetical protein
VTGFASMTKASLDFADTVSASATRIGIGTEALQALRFAASDADVDVGQLERSLSILNKKAGEAAGDVEGKAAKAFRALGVEIRDSNGAIKSTEVLFAEVGKGIDGLGSQAEKAAASQKLLGDRTGALIPLFRDQGAAMAESMERAREFGAVISDDLIVEGANLHRQFEELGQFLGTRFKSWLLDAAGAFNAVAESMRNLPMEERGARNIAAQLKDSLAKEVALGDLELEAARSGRARLPPGGAPDLGLPSGSSGSREEIQRARAAAAAETARLRDLLERASVPPTPRTSGLADDFSGGAAASHSAAADAARDQAAAEKLLQGLAEDRLRAEGDTIGLLQQRFRVESEAIAASSLSDEQRLQANADLAATFDAQVRAAVDAQDEIGKFGEKGTAEIEEMTWQGQLFTDTLRTGLGQLVSEGKVAWADLANSFLTQVVDKALYAGIEAITDFIALQITSAALGAASGGSGGGGGGGWISGILGAIGLASGGVVTKPTFAMIGEAGPEAVVPLDRLGSLGGGGKVTVIVNNNAGAQVDVTQRRGAGGANEIEIAVNREVARAMSSGPVRKVMETSFGAAYRGSRRG